MGKEKKQENKAPLLMDRLLFLPFTNISPPNTPTLQILGENWLEDLQMYSLWLS